MSEEQKQLDRYFIKIRKIWETPTLRKFSTTTATLALIGFFLFVALKPTVETIFTLNKKIQDLTEVEQLMTKKISDINQAIGTYQQIQTVIPILEEYYPQEANAKQIIEILETNAQKSGLANPNFNISSYQLSGGLGLFSMTFNTENAFPNVMNFLENIDRSRRLINIMSFSINELKEKNGVGVTLGTDIYYEKR
jgi:hypothetical protein